MKNHPNIPVIKDDELISSWLVRASFHCGCDSLSLTGSIWPGWRAWTTDIDRGLPQSKMGALTSAMGITAESLTNHALTGIGSFRPKEGTPPCSMIPWVLALGTRNRRRHGGLMYCPECLSERDSAYFKKDWRMAWHIACERHLRMLRDRCPYCSCAIEPHRLNAFDTGIFVCATCKHDTRFILGGPADADALYFQRMADAVFLMGYGNFGDCRISAAEWFDLSRFFIALVRRAIRSKSKKLAAFVELLSHRQLPGQSKTLLPLELLPVEERAGLFAILTGMLARGPSGFKEIAMATGVSGSALIASDERIPPSLAASLAELPSLRTPHPHRRHSLIKPLSPAHVLHIWARLKRSNLRGGPDHAL